jgi:hypothetical protein
MSEGWGGTIVIKPDFFEVGVAAFLVSLRFFL